MYFFTTCASLLAITASIPVGSGLGINCRGSLYCSYAGDKPVPIAVALHQAVFASEKPLSTVYHSGEHISCVNWAQFVEGFCLFPQIPKGASITLETIRGLIDALVMHKCTRCGSVPIHFVDKGSNDPRAGILTINYVNHPSCTGNCIPVPAQPRGQVKIPLLGPERN